MAVVRAVQQPLRAFETVLGCGFGIVQHAVLQPGHHIHQYRRTELATGQYVVADGDFHVHGLVEKALVDTFIAPAQQHHPRQLGQLARQWLGQRTPLRAEVDHRCRPRIGGFRRFQAGPQRLDQHHHARAATEGTVVHPAVIALRMVARIPTLQFEQPTFLRPPDHAERRALRDELGEQADDVDAHWGIGTGEWGEQERSRSTASIRNPDPSRPRSGWPRNPPT